MALVSTAYDTAQSGTILVPATEDRLIRVVQMVATSWATASVALLSDPGGTGEDFLTRGLHFAAGQPLILRLGRLFALCTARGKSLGVTTSYQSTVQPLSLAVWYELVS